MKNIDSRHTFLARFGKASVFVAAISWRLATLPTAHLFAQSATATLSGSAVDPDGARIPGAVLTLQRDATADRRSTVSNSEGVYYFAPPPAGSYTLLARREGFKAAEEKGIILHPADSQNLNVTLQIGAATETVVVRVDERAPDTCEHSGLISASDIQHLSLQGRDVSELVSTQAGFAIVPPYGLTNGTYDPGQVTTGGGLSVLSNGADIADPTSGNSTTQNINQEIVQEVQIQTSAFGANHANGPIVLSAITKSGGTAYHGAVYDYFRGHILDTQNWFSKNQGLPDAHFNKSKRRTFFVGAEDYVQRNVYAYGSALQSSILALVPTANMRAGNFSQGELANYLGTDTTTLANNCTSGTPASERFSWITNFVHLCEQPNGTTNSGLTVTNGNLAGGMDPGASAPLNTLPLPNRTSGNGFNYVTTNFENNDLWRLVSKVDDAATDKLKLSLSYSAERGRMTGIPETQSYSPANGSPAMGGVDTPGKSVARVFTQSLSLNAVYIFTATMTNEVNASAKLNRNDFKLHDSTLLQASSVDAPTAGSIRMQPTRSLSSEITTTTDSPSRSIQRCRMVHSFNTRSPRHLATTSPKR
jgi:hypothetical protein